MNDSPLTTVLLLAGIALVTVSLLIRIHRYLRRQRAKPPRENVRGSASREPVDPSPGTPAAWNRSEVEMHERARELMARLDGKISVLRAMVAEADRAAARLERARAEMDTEATLADCPVDPEEVHILADYGHGATEIARRLGCPVGRIESILRDRGKAT